MAPEISSPHPRFAKQRKILSRVLNAVIVMIALICLATYVYPTILLHRELSFIRQNGQPVTSAEALPPPIPQSQNAAPLYLRAAKLMQFKSSCDCENLSAKKMNAILQKNAQTINLIRQATDKPQCRFNLVRDENNSLVPPIKLTKFSDLARLLAIQSRSEAQAGNKDEALQDIRRQFIMASHIAQEPLLLCSFMTRSIQNIANRTLAKVLLHISLTSSETHDLEISLPQIDWASYLYRILLTERAMDIENAQSSRNQSKTGTFVFIQVLKMGEVYSLRLWKVIIHDEENAPIPVPSDYTKQLDHRIDQAPWYAFSAMTLVVYPRARRNYDYAEVQSRERQIALALAVYHSQYHQYPTTLEPAEKLWKSTFPLDIYSKKPFRYKSDGKTFLLYSVGLNGKDDGGVWKYTGNDATSKDDLAWKNIDPKTFKSN